MRALIDEIREVQSYRWNMDRSIALHTVIMQQMRHITTAHVIQWRIRKHLDAWEADQYHMLVEKNTCTYEQ